MKFSPKLILLAVILLASILRLYRLDSIPPSLDWDEASLGYNAYSISKTGSDEYGNFLPFSIRSFNDYKPPAYTYLAIPFVTFLGLTELAVRLPSALAGIIAVIGTYFLAQELFIQSKRRHAISLISTLLLAISPWHLQFSRAAFEANLSLTFYLLSVLFLLKWINQSQSKLIHLLSSAAFASAALYAYHSARIVVPIVFLMMSIYFHKKILSRLKPVITSIVFGLLLIVPLLFILSRPATSERFKTTSIFTNPGLFSRETQRLDRIADYRADSIFPLSLIHHPYTVFAKIILRGYLEHFNFDFLFLTGDGNARHTTTGMGLLYLIEAPFLIFGIYKLAANKHKNPKIIWLWLLAGPLAASLTTNTPHAVRSLLMLPSFQLITAYGIVSMYQYIDSLFLKRTLFIVSCSLFLVSFLVYINLYYVVSPFKTSGDWQYGYKQLVAKVGELESDFDHIIITNKYDQPHIFFAFYDQIDPLTYQSFALTAHQGFGKLQFKQIEFNTDMKEQNTLVVADPEHSPKDVTPFHQIKFLNGDTAFNFYSKD